MAGDFDGTAYLGIDQNAWGEGTSDGNTHALSTYLENRLDANARYLQKRGSQVTYQFYQDGNTENLRSFTSVERSALIYTLWPIRSNTSEITIHLLGEVKNDDSNTTGKVEITVSFLGPDGTRDTQSQTMTAAGSPEVQTVTLDMTTQGFAEGVGRLGVWISSANQTGPGSGGSTSGTTEDQLYEVQNLSSFDARNTLATTLNGWEWLAGHRYEDPDNSKVWTFIYNDTSAGRDLGIVELSYLEPQSITIEERFDDGARGGNYAPKPARQMRAQESVLGQHVSRHGTNLDDVWGRERCLAVGPAGQDEGQNWPTGEKRKWTWHDEVSGATDLVLDRQMLNLRDEQSRLSCYALLSFLRQPSDFLPANFSDDEKTVKEYSGVGDVGFRLLVEQLENGDTSWSAASELVNKTDVYEELTIFPMIPVSVSHLLIGAAYARKPHGWASESSEFNHIFREGQIWKNDRLYLQPVYLTTTLPNSTNQQDPVRASLEFASFSSGPDYSDDSDDGTKTHLICTQTAWFEEATL